jgi:hypothetical protein
MTSLLVGVWYVGGVGLAAADAEEEEVQDDGGDNKLAVFAAGPKRAVVEMSVHVILLGSSCCLLRALFPDFDAPALEEELELELLTGSAGRVSSSIDMRYGTWSPLISQIVFDRAMM